ncbi:TlpA family protein disulfide reductase [Pedobacter sp. UBA5917]|jgi:thiol-disulfide isomerase/thioredoxin|uniref:TlpA family protein disulfide reductase n=1 Tax=Pedobacter sp. UBA5917 TaxID=1947061 RepID=UPI0025D6C9F4|nr:TlpA disulfide reductase family protein [Pedobacter sp. UBA5917]
MKSSSLYQKIILAFFLSTVTVNLHAQKEGNHAGKTNNILTEANQNLLPDVLYTSWYNKNNSRLEIAFYNESVVYDNKVWAYKNAVKKPNSTHTLITITNGKETRQLSLSGLNNSDISLTVSNKTIWLSRNQDNCKRIAGKERYQLPILKNDSAIFSGYIKNYNPETGPKTMMLYSSNIVSGMQDKKMINIQKNGYFTTKIDILHPGRLFLSPKINTGYNIYLEPGKELFIIIDEEKIKYAGALAQLNEDLDKLSTLNLFNDFEVKRKIVNMTANDYKAYCLNLQKKEISQLDSIHQLGNLSEKAYQVKKLDIVFDYAKNIMEYNWIYESAIGDQNEELKKKSRRYPSDYYDFFDRTIINNELSLISGNYGIFVNRVKFLPGLRPDKGVYLYNYLEMFNGLKKGKVTLTANDIAFSKLISANGDSLKTDSTTQHIQDLWFKERSDYLDVYGIKNASNSNLKRIDSALNLKQGILLDLMRAQEILTPIVFQSTPINDTYIPYALSDIGNPFIKNYIKNRNNETKKQLIANKKNSGYFINQTPQVEADKVLENIISKYNGKVILLDFWATWCGPCLNGIEEIKPLKEEMKDSNVVFVYITDESSPQKMYENLAPTIKGQHYRLNDKEWRYLTERFKITSIPRQLLISKEGKVLNPDLGFMDNGQLKKLLEKQL